MIRRFGWLFWLGSFGFVSSLSAVSINFGGHFRTEGALYNKPGLGAPNTNPTKTYLTGRALLQPKLVIDDHFTINSQWSLLTSPNMTPDATTGLGAGQGGFIFGDPNTKALVLSRAWLEWISDFGVVRIGRMPVSWGYGLVWDGGNETWDDFQTTFDRLEYRLHFGHVVGALAFSKTRKLSVLGNDNDADYYTAYLRYDNPEQDLEIGALFERQIRSPSQEGDLMTGVSGANPYSQPAPTPTGAVDNRPPLAKTSPYPLSNSVLDLYLKKKIDYFTLGGEGAWATGTAVDFNQNGVPDNLNAFGLLLNVTYEYHKYKAFLDFLYASGDTSINSDRLNGFVLLHRNRRPGLILGRELLGPYNNNNVGQGSLLYYGDSGSFSGAYYLKPGFRIDWTQSWATGIEFIIAKKAATNPGETAHLGVEVDAGAEYAMYKNFDLGLTLGYLFAGDGLQQPGPSGVFAFRTTASLKF